MTIFEDKDKHNEVWEMKMDKIYQAIDELQDKQLKDEESIYTEINRHKDKYDKFVESKSYKITAKTDKTIQKQTDKFEVDRMQRKEELDKNIEMYKENINEIIKKSHRKEVDLRAKLEKYKLNLYTTDSPTECEHCKGCFWRNEIQREKHEESLEHLLNAKLIEPIKHGLTCNICKETFTQYHAEPNKNPEYVEHMEQCRLDNAPPMGDDLNCIYDIFEEKLMPMKITFKNQRSIFNLMGIINKNNLLSKFVDRLEEGWEYAYGEHKKYVDKDDIRLIYLLDDTRTCIYCIDEQGNPTEICTVEEADETDGFGKGVLLIMPQRPIGYDTRDRNPPIRMPKSGILRERGITNDEIKSLGIFNPNRNCWLENTESHEARRVLERMLTDNPGDRKRVTRTTTTVAN